MTVYRWCQVQAEFERLAGCAVQCWPTVATEPVPKRDDGRFVKSFPLEFQMGVADLR